MYNLALLFHIIILFLLYYLTALPILAPVHIAINLLTPLTVFIKKFSPPYSKSEIALTALLYRFCFLLPDWVISLGPEKDGLYEYSVATDPFKMGLYVLARDVATFRMKYEHEVLLFVREQGFILPINKPIAIPQNDKCLYPPTVKVTPVAELNITKYLGRWYEVS